MGNLLKCFHPVASTGLRSPAICFMSRFASIFHFFIFVLVGSERKSHSVFSMDIFMYACPSDNGRPVQWIKGKQDSKEHCHFVVDRSFFQNDFTPTLYGKTVVLFQQCCCNVSITDCVSNKNLRVAVFIRRKTKSGVRWEMGCLRPNFHSHI